MEKMIVWGDEFEIVASANSIIKPEYKWEIAYVDETTYILKVPKAYGEETILDVLTNQHPHPYSKSLRYDAYYIVIKNIPLDYTISILNNY